MSVVNLVSARRVLCATGLLSLSALLCFSQGGVAGSTPQDQPAQTAPKPSDLLQPALNQVSQAIVSLNISRWKAPSEVRAATQQNADSIQRDLNGTLPGLLATADAGSGTVSAVFPVYRNIDALYDVLLRVSQTAMLAAPENEASSVTNALGKLESARTDLGNAILATSKNNEAETAKLQAIIQQVAAAKAAEPPKTTIVDDGPVKSTASTKKKKKPISSSSGSQPSGSTQPQP
ncbi:hypothetical protein [Alloacidobacterium sp.]|uniref:hypothetical protein n=1 Tax=Alloacidobacterium sp. TaxID=2951999 RepID=UPI002D37DC61|nr:hypothetical protein [Alloacidobacterium sp.]HYK36252.1 hypothetical protein [Alloacidobacterium sp.]